MVPTILAGVYGYLLGWWSFGRLTRFPLSLS
jgi:hypothetical protein